MRLMRTLTATAAAVSLILLGGTAASAARPTVRPGGTLAAGQLIRQHQCRPGAVYGSTVTGWLADDRETARRDLVWLPMGGPTNGTWRWDIKFTCYR